MKVIGLNATRKDSCGSVGAKYFEKQTNNEFNWSRDITERAKKEYARSYSNPKFNRYFELAGSKTDPTLLEYSIMHGVLGVLVWNALRPR
jgi:hypothetical protein